MREQVELLKYHSHFLTEFVNVCLRIRDIRSLKIDVSAGRSFQQVHAAQKCGFTGTGWSDHADNIPLAYLGGNIGQDL